MKRYSTSDRLKQIMKTYNLRQVDILEKCKPYCDKYGIRLGRNDLSQYVSGKVEPGQEKLTILSKALGVPESWLMGLDVPMKENETVGSILNRQLKRIGKTLEDVAEKANVPLLWLKNIDSFVPGEMDDVAVPHEIDWDSEIGAYRSYEWITKVAEVLDLPGSTLRAALARQEIPAYNGPITSPEEDFYDVTSVDEGNSEAVREGHGIYTIAAHHDDPEWTKEELEEIERFKEFVKMRRDQKK